MLGLKPRFREDRRASGGRNGLHKEQWPDLTPQTAVLAAMAALMPADNAAYLRGKDSAEQQQRENDACAQARLVSQLNLSIQDGAFWTARRHHPE
jgi:hypothetical protein